MWSTTYKVGSRVFTAADFLDDPTKANPKLISGASDSLKFKLTIIRFSQFGYTLADYRAYISPGDTIKLNHNIGGGIKPLSYSWRPHYNISDTSLSNPHAWPDSALEYQVVATDSVGCKSQPDRFKVFIKPNAILSENKTRHHPITFPNPISSDSRISYEKGLNDNLNIKIINYKGQTVLNDRFTGGFYKLGDKISNAGLYLYFIDDNHTILTSGRFVKKLINNLNKRSLKLFIKS